MAAPPPPPMSTTHAVPKLKDSPILGRENLPSEGVLLIPSQLAYHDVLQLEKLFHGRAIVYLTVQGAALDARVKSHLHGESVHALEIVPNSTDTSALRKEIQDEVKKGSVVVYVPQQTATQTAPLSSVPGTRLEFLMEAHVPVLPLYVLHTNDVALAIESRKAEGDAVYAFGPVLRDAEVTVAKYQESLMLLNEQAFSQNPTLDMNLAYALLKGLKKHGSLTLVDGKDEKETSTLPYDKLLAAAIALSKHVKAVTQKPRVGVILPPGAGAMIANLAVLFAGKVPVNINFSAGRPAVESAIKQADLDHYLTADLFVRKLQTFPWPPNRQLTFIERTLPTLKGAMTTWFLLSKILPASVLASMLGIPTKGGNKEALLLFTSGSSGDPKGVALTHRNLMANVMQFGSRLALRHDDKILGCLPLFHSFGCTVTLWYPIIQGIGLVTYPSPLETKKLAELIGKHKITLFISTPTFLRGYLKGVNPELFASLKLVVTGAEKLPKAVAEAFEARFGKRVFEGYGLTETSPVSNVNLPDPETTGDELMIPSYRFGSVGQLIPGLAVKLTDPESDEPVSIHESGMVWFKGPNVFEGYLKNPKKTEEVIKDGWFRTGDIGRMDKDGFLYIEGRLSRFSKVGGEMVPHETVEDALVKALGLETEAMRRIAVVGVPDVEKGEALVLLTTLPGGSVQQEILDLRYKLLDRGMAPLWIPKKMVRVPEIPVLPSGKLDVKGCEKLAKTAGW
ncbi:acyl-[acyl-carrier-protein]-phospholipid O-acyltransferase/long-chain-fatty-acid--[acyl-carrier-protein] ligase [Roseimicrobium gellanilyticum]|uniref:Acyl-[acyl-carrier-protein]-phospholipid O-acyltransferase/long-chain-fatty-acid--[acyl-carrier-protein] ligase n=2 Tax=Roseimicrobium gellanilyticum TaxID=748857 RepID=A0A366H6D9_9BACT|nr:acyl-[acyl-carrier-protein]-phospholipid O-acyltransferase/long-chain-fatty-acid--[acyl-carrier-protein] ligase [Roseimicrobium gellanilyticum]